MKKLIVFDLDGTLAESKSPVGAEMGTLLARLLEVIKVAIISGGGWLQFEIQVLSNFPKADRMDNLSLLPTCGTQFYKFEGNWTKLYSEDLASAEKIKIIDALNAALDESGYRPKMHWGDLIEDRGSQITLSALGQRAPLREKKDWDGDFSKRNEIKALLVRLIPGYSINLGGATSIDVTKTGIDKGYGIRKLRDVLKVDIANMLFIGDALFPGGNDYPAKEAGAVSIEVRDPAETKRVIEAIVECL
ncbi:MAG: HAD-IIB family hydrolase [Rhodomicrobium sp.]